MNAVFFANSVNTLRLAPARTADQVLTKILNRDAMHLVWVFCVGEKRLFHFGFFTNLPRSSRSVSSASLSANI